VSRDYAARFHHGIDLSPDHTALVLVDLQLASASRHHGLGAILHVSAQGDTATWRFDRIDQLVVPNVTKLLAAVRARQGVVAHVALGSRREDLSDIPPYLRPLVRATDNRVGAPNHAFIPQVEPERDEPVVVKSTADAFLGTDLDAQLRSLGIETVALAGVSTNSCVESTARHAADLGYGVALVEDACAAADRSLHDAAVKNLRRLFVDVVTTAQVVRSFASPGRG
jgi:biuret amidohydrolase